jgi:hypothetical protein
MALILAGALLALFVANVSFGSISGQPPLGNVAEMLLLLGASIAFVVAILKRESEDSEAGRLDRGQGAEPMPSEAEPGGSPRRD